MQGLRYLVRLLASLKLTLLALVLFAIAVVYVYLGEQRYGLALVPPLVLLTLNLTAAVATYPIFRQSLPLLLFHLALIAIIVLVAAGRLTYLRGHVELSEGEEFAGRLTETDAGVWHRFALDKVHFSNEGFNISYSEGLQRGKTRNRVAYPDASGKLKSFEIGDQTPLVLQGYRFYTSPNKGFAPTFLWQPTNGQPVLGTVHLPSYPINEYRQSRDWVLPGSTLSLWTMLQFDEVILDPDKPSEFRLPEKHKVVVRVGELRRELQSGESMELPQGKLVYQGLRSWMGYTVFYDWTIYWLLASCVLAIGAMAWYFWTKYFSHPWNE
jgi:cytochrome c biogenesis protein